LEVAQRRALDSYRRFLADEEGQPVEAAAAFGLRTAIRAGLPARAADPRPTLDPPSRPRRRERRPSIVAAGAAAIGAMLVAAGALLLTASDTQQLTVYSSLPLEGMQRTRSQDIIGGIRIALKEAGARAGRFEVRYKSLDDATSGTRAWAQEAVSRNALRAAGDDSTAAYIGELNSGASAVSIPILSRGKVPQISPSNTAVGLTTSEPGADEDEPDTYYVGGFRNYVRIVPRDTVQGDAIATVMRQDGCERVALVHDLDRHGRGLARVLRRSSATRGLRLVLDEPITSRSAASRRSLAASAARHRADCAVFSADTSRGTVMVVETLARALPRARLYGSAGVADRAFTDDDLGGLPRRVAARVKLTLPIPGRDGLGAAAKRFYEKFAREHPDVRRPNPYAIYGYEAMKLALSVIARSGTAEREDIVKALFDTEDRRSVIGTYSIDANGDTSLADYGLFAIRDGELVLERRITTTD